VDGGLPVARIAVGFDASAPGAVIEWAAAEAMAHQAASDVVAFGTAGSSEGDQLAPTSALRIHASRAELVIVGSSADFGPARWLRICVPSFSSRRSACPIVVVRGLVRQPLRRIVVGIDVVGDDGAALDWAADEAERHGAELVVVHGWQRETAVRHSVRRDGLARSDADSAVALAVRRCGERVGRAVAGKVIEGEAVSALATSSAAADLLVVGSRGASGYRTLVFGSVTLLIVDRASCPVAVIPPRFRWREPKLVAGSALRGGVVTGSSRVGERGAGA
jgi:nucleotide-binding universal stress UspA family protein